MITIYTTEKQAQYILDLLNKKDFSENHELYEEGEVFYGNYRNRSAESASGLIADLTSLPWKRR